MAAVAMSGERLLLPLRCMNVCNPPDSCRTDLAWVALPAHIVSALVTLTSMASIAEPSGSALGDHAECWP